MKTKYIILIMALIIPGMLPVLGQQTIRFSNYLFNKVILNPAAAGSNDYIEAMGSYRKQWVGFEGAPSTSFFTVDGSTMERRLGLGLQFVSDKAGALKSNGVMLSVASRVRLGWDRFLSVGVGVGYFGNTMNGNELYFQDQREMVIPSSNEQVNVLDMRLGVYYKDRKYMAGISAFNLLEPVINYTGQERTLTGNLNRHYYFLFGRYFSLNREWDILPSVMYKLSEEGNGQLDLNLRAMFDNKIGGGLGYRNGESMVIMAEFFPTGFLRFGYAYDLSLNKIQTYNSGSHEFMAAYRIISNKRLTNNPRYIF